jgi:hypothetical protein
LVARVRVTNGYIAHHHPALAIDYGNKVAAGYGEVDFLPCIRVGGEGDIAAPVGGTGGYPVFECEVFAE